MTVTFWLRGGRSPHFNLLKEKIIWLLIAWFQDLKRPGMREENDLVSSTNFF